MVGEGSGREDPDDKLRNLALLAYVALKTGQSPAGYTAMAWAGQQIGGDVLSNFYKGEYFYKMMLDAYNFILVKDARTIMKNTPVMALYLDLHKGHLLIRMGYLTEAFARKTVFWQARQLGSFNSKAILEGVQKSVDDVPHAKVPEDVLISESDFFKKLVVFGADGAPDLGCSLAPSFLLCVACGCLLVLFLLWFVFWLFVCVCFVCLIDCLFCLSACLCVFSVFACLRVLCLFCVVLC